MTKVLEDAIEKVRQLPEDRHAHVAEILEQIAAFGSDPLVVPEPHRAAVLQGLAEAERGEYVSDEDMAALEKVWPVRLRFSPQAYADIADIHECIAQHSP